MYADSYHEPAHDDGMDLTTALCDSGHNGSAGWSGLYTSGSSFDLFESSHASSIYIDAGTDDTRQPQT